MRILHINSYYANDKFYKKLTDELIELNTKLTVYVPTIKSFNNNFNYGKYTIIGNSYRNSDRFFFKYKTNKILNDIINQININEYDIFHAHSLFSNGYVAYKLFKRYKIPYIVAVRGTDINMFFKRLIYLRSVGSKILINASKIIFISPEHMNTLLKKYVPKKYRDIILNKSIIIPNGIDNFWLENKYHKKNFFENDKIRIIQVGDINRNKNVLTTVKAVELLSNEGYNIELSIVGKVISNRILNKINDKRYVNYKGYMSKENLLLEYRKHDIFVLPSYSETFGLVYVEAMTQGLPLIYSRGQGFDNQYKDGLAGKSVNPKKHKEISENIISIINNINIISEHNVNNVNKFNWSLIAQKYFKIYSDILKKG